jgi:phosphate starvation-inducible PhoH-like protein
LSRRRKTNFSNNPKNHFPLFKFKTAAQKHAFNLFNKVDVLFLIGPAGVGKTFLAMAMAIQLIEKELANKIFLTRPIIESEESLGYLPGDIKEKTNPYMLPLYDQIEQLKDQQAKEFTSKHIRLAPLAYMRGRTFNQSVCIFDEAQNATEKQLKLLLSRLGNESKIIITGDPSQADIRDSGLMQVVDKLDDIDQIGIVEFKSSEIVRHPVVEQILDRLG